MQTIPIIVPADGSLIQSAETYINTHPSLEGYNLNPQWADESRETVVLEVPIWEANLEDLDPAIVGAAAEVPILAFAMMLVSSHSYKD